MTKLKLDLYSGIEIEKQNPLKKKQKTLSYILGIIAFVSFTLIQISTEIAYLPMATLIIISVFTAIASLFFYFSSLPDGIHPKKGEIWIEKNFITVIKDGITLKLPLQDYQLMEISSDYYYDAEIKHKIHSGQLKITLQSNFEKTEINTALKDRKEYFHFIKILKTIYLEKIIPVKETNMKGDAVILLKEEYDYERIQLIKHELGIKSIY